MKEPIWITREVVLATQEELLSRFGGLPGVRDDGLLDSALNRPVQLFHYGSPSVYDLAAVYTSGIIRYHPFFDGNKRAGFMAAYIFLGINGLNLDATEEDVVINTLALAAGEMNEKKYAAWLKKSCRKPASKRRK